MIALAVGVALPATASWGPVGRRIVAREKVEPPFNVRQYPSPLSAFRHYKKDLAEQTGHDGAWLPARTRVRLAAFGRVRRDDLYDERPEEPGVHLGRGPVGWAGVDGERA